MATKMPKKKMERGREAVRQPLYALCFYLSVFISLDTIFHPSQQRLSVELGQEPDTRHRDLESHRQALPDGDCDAVCPQHDFPKRRWGPADEAWLVFGTQRATIKVNSNNKSTRMMQNMTLINGQIEPRFFPLFLSSPI